MTQPVFNLTGGDGTIDLQVDGSVRLKLVFQLGIGVTLPVGTTIVVDTLFQPTATNDQKQMELAQLAEKWKTKGP